MRARRNSLRTLRPLIASEPVRVHRDAQGRPESVVLKGKVLEVASIREAWRIDDEWWRTPLSRWYFQLVLENGRLLTVYRDLRSRRWFAQPGG